MRIYILLLFVLLLSSNFTTTAVDRCACGDYYSSITTFFVEEGQDCCEGEISSGVGYETYYEPQGGGVFKLIAIFEIDGKKAQNTCCN